MKWECPECGYQFNEFHTIDVNELTINCCPRCKADDWQTTFQLKDNSW